MRRKGPTRVPEVGHKVVKVETPIPLEVAGAKGLEPLAFGFGGLFPTRIVADSVASRYSGAHPVDASQPDSPPLSAPLVTLWSQAPPPHRLDSATSPAALRVPPPGTHSRQRHLPTADAAPGTAGRNSLTSHAACGTTFG